MKAKRITSLILALALALSLCLTGCGIAPKNVNFLISSSEYSLSVPVSVSVVEVSSVSDSVFSACVVFSLSDPQPVSMEAAIIVVVSSAVNFLNFMFTSLCIFEVFNLVLL